MITNKWVLSETLVHFYRNLNKSIRVLKKTPFIVFFLQLNISNRKLVLQATNWRTLVPYRTLLTYQVMNSNNMFAHFSWPWLTQSIWWIGQRVKGHRFISSGNCGWNTKWVLLMTREILFYDCLSGLLHYQRFVTLGFRLSTGYD